MSLNNGSTSSDSSNSGVNVNLVGGQKIRETEVDNGGKEILGAPEVEQQQQKPPLVKD